MSRSNRSWPIVDAWVEAAQAAGFPYNDDYNAQDQYGVGYFQLTARKGLRCSSAKAYLKPIRHRKNLHVITNVLTSRVLFDGKRAIGMVETEQYGSKMLHIGGVNRMTGKHGFATYRFLIRFDKDLRIQRHKDIHP